VKLILAFSLFLAGCVSGPQMPTEPFRCFDSDGHEIPCVDEMDCHEAEQNEDVIKELKERVGFSGCVSTCSPDGTACLSNCVREMYR
jgi:hypothetical protein